MHSFGVVLGVAASSGRLKDVTVKAIARRAKNWKRS
jgi:hypothetical protein